MFITQSTGAFSYLSTPNGLLEKAPLATLFTQRGETNGSYITH
uniref:Uncharacterized protein n=1 Tax=Arundo donax TaxID=35708 RepID=A0A0A8YCK3_ARUDO